MNEIYLLTGGNLGDRLNYLQKASEHIAAKAGTVVKKSSVYETAPWGFTEQQSFLNQVLCIGSTLAPEPLLYQLLQIEIELGRKRIEKMGPRVIDIDILFYNDLVISAPGLTIPHPRIGDRRFVLTPLDEIAPGFVHPAYKKTVKELLHECKDPLDVSFYEAAR